MNKTFTYPGLGTCQRYRRCDPIAFLYLSTGVPGSTKQKQQRDEQRRENKTISLINRHRQTTASKRVQSFFITVDILPGHFKGLRNPKDSSKRPSVCTKSIPDVLRTSFNTKYKKNQAISIKTWCNSKMAPTADGNAHVQRLSAIPVSSRPKYVRDNPGGIVGSLLQVLGQCIFVMEGQKFLIMTKISIFTVLAHKRS